MLPLPASRATQRSSLQDSHLRLLTETAKREAPLEPGQPAPLAEANLEKPLARLQENPLAGLVMPPDLPLPRLREMAKLAMPSDSELLTHLALAKRKALLAIRRLPEGNPLAEAM